MGNLFSDLEQRLQEFVESLANLLPDKNPIRDLVHKLVKCMRENLYSDVNKQTFAPGSYQIRLAPTAAASLEQIPGWTHGLEKTLKQVALENEIKFSSPLQFEIIPDANAPETIIVSCNQSNKKLEETAAMSSSVPLNKEKTQNAFFLVNGQTTYPIRESVINIGRRSDNQLVIDDPRVSRVHAQLRIQSDRAILFDLNSTGGTFVNGTRINQASLNAGDVVSLAGFPLIYGIENGNSIPIDPKSDFPTIFPVSGGK
jgi:pSer/pThr/pTyr-binding forkhead associated (FHA) protein